AGAAARSLSGSKKAVFALPVADAASAEAVAQGALLGAYTYTAYQAKSNGKTPLAEVALVGAKPRDKAYKAAADRAIALADEINRARDLINMPPNDLHPQEFATVVQAAAEEHGLKVEVLDEKALAKGGYGGILGVGKGSANPPRLVKLSYRTAKAKKHLAFVGKGITYDSGGISLKPAGHNETMKCDMSGAAAVFAAVVAAAKLGLEVNVTGWLALAENMPSGTATRPGDVLRMYSGKTVEVLNTDAEGRLVLADGLSLAVEAGADVILDLATLTGACIVALGRKIAGLMGNDQVWVDQVQQAAERAGESVWPLPLPEEYRKLIDSEVADVKNIGGGRYAGALTAGLFLREFVGDVAWAHLDIAGPARSEEDEGYVTKGGTGFGVRTILEAVTGYVP
ncbi:MAG: leucyl aminopeptidase, partial [Actinomycetota bacterium]|nr:leucyl aminopeptidase [Actinomycetota bacterium]